MKTQKYNQGELKELKINIEADLVDSFQIMVENTQIPLEDLVVIALRRFRTSHCDYLKSSPATDD